MAQRVGAVIIFSPKFTQEQADRFLRVAEEFGIVDGSKWIRYEDNNTQRPVEGETPTYVFDEKNGWPVFYTP